MHYVMMRSQKTGEIELVSPDRINILHIKTLASQGWKSIGDVMLTAEISHYDLVNGLTYKERARTQEAYAGQKRLREELRRARGWADEAELPYEERWPDRAGEDIPGQEDRYETENESRT